MLRLFCSGHLAIMTIMVASGLFISSAAVVLCLQCFALLVWRQEGHQPVKNTVAECWHGYLSGAMCRLAYGPADATATHCLLLQ